jgi:hypothetical protein
MTCEVIDRPRAGWLPGCVTGNRSGHPKRYDRTLRVVMWLDAFLSAAVAVLCVIASPVVALLGLPYGVLAATGVAAIGCAAVLAGCGAVTGVLLMLRLRAGEYLLPIGLRLPLPAVMRPHLPRVSDQLGQPAGVHRSQPQHHQRPAVVGASREEQLRLAEQ